MSESQDMGETLRKLRRLFHEIRMDWSDPRYECREGMALIDAALASLTPTEEKPE